LTGISSAGSMRAAMTLDEFRALSSADREQARSGVDAVAPIDREHERQRARLHALFEEAPLFLTVVEGPELRVTMINRRARQAPSGTMALGKTVRELVPADNPLLATLERVYATGVPETISGHPSYFPAGAHQGRYFTREFVPLRDENGNVDRILVSTYEITEEVRARHTHEESERRSHAEQQRLFALLEEAPIVITVLEGPELRIEMRNRRARELMAGRHLYGVPFGDLVPPTNTTFMAASRVLATGVPEALEVTSQDVEGFVGRSFSITIVPIRDPNGQITRVMTASLETTEQRRAMAALETHTRDLEAARREAVDASRAKDEFLAMLGHELRNPLAPMFTTLELMRIRGAASREIDVLERQVRHLARLVADLLDISRIKRGLIELKRRDLDLRSSVRRALEMTNPLIEQRRNRIVADLAPVAVHGDPDRLAQAIGNLITNASKYSPPGAAIRIFTHRSGDLARIIVADDGVGIAPDLIDRVFDAFAQHPQKLARSHGGLGLGLSIVKSLIEAHGGTITAQSDGPDRGSAFVIELPAITATRATDTPPPPPPPQPTSLPKRVLVVDDNCDAATALKAGLEALGYVVAVAHDGPSALTEAAAFKPQIGLLDIGLPVMDGYELAAALRAVHDIRLIAITGYGQERDRERSREAGFDSHLVKPVNLQQVGALLHRIAVDAPDA